jgi:hypothetical protein
VLAFAVQLLKHTMPEQPLSGRLSLAQAVVSVNSRSKAAYIGLAGKGSAEEVWGVGQPKVKVMSREITVLKRNGYEWKEPVKEKEKNVKEEEQEDPDVQAASTEAMLPSASSEMSSKPVASRGWTVSSSVTLKKSTFVARSITIRAPSEARYALEKLLASNEELREASHNITAWRVQTDHGIVEDYNDDSEPGGGRHILGVMQSDNVVGVLLLVSRWYGGIMLGTDRWRIMSQVSRDALSQRLRVAGVIGQDALWGLDLEAMRTNDSPVTGGTTAGMPIHKPESARAYIMKAFASPPSSTESPSKKTSKAIEAEKEQNLGLLLGALDMLFGSWKDHISKEELDRRAWGWYVQVRPEVESGVAGWGGKGKVKLSEILSLRRKE